MSLLHALHPRHLGSGIHPAMRGMADEVLAAGVRILAYLGALAALGLLAMQLIEAAHFDFAAEAGAAAKPAWVPAVRGHPAFAIGRPDTQSAPEYQSLRHPAGGRRDILQWGGVTSSGRAAAQIEVYRPGAEFDDLAPPVAVLAQRFGVPEDRFETAGLIETKFGIVGLWRLADDNAGRGCMGFSRDFAAPLLRLSGWSCVGDSAQSQRLEVGCALDRLTLLASCNDPKLAELFAHIFDGHNATLTDGVTAALGRPARDFADFAAAASAAGAWTTDQTR